MNSLEPQDRMDSQLKKGVRYVTTVAYGGHANQFIALVKLLYLAKITNRVAILPTLIPLHFDADPVDFGSFFDLAPLRHYSHIPVVEFSELKPFDLSFQGAEMETLGCWSTQEATQGHPNSGGLVSMDIHQIGVTFWPLPPTLQRSGPDLAYEGLKIFDHERTAQDRWVDQVREEFLPQGLLPPPPVETEGGLSVSTFDKSTNVKPGFNPFSDPPSEQLVCYDNALFLSPLLFPDPFPGATDPLEPILPGEDTSWIEAGQFIHFSPHIEMLVDDYLRATLELSPNLRLPNLITVHLRRTDFLEFTGLTPLERYVLAVERARTRLAVVFPGREYEVLATTDEAVEGSDFIDHVRNLGWKVLDHDAMTTIATHGGWYPTILDAAILARGDGLVGTAKSTFSHLSVRASATTRELTRPGPACKVLERRRRRAGPVSSSCNRHDKRAGLVNSRVVSFLAQTSMLPRRALGAFARLPRAASALRMAPRFAPSRAFGTTRPAKLATVADLESADSLTVAPTSDMMGFEVSQSTSTAGAENVEGRPIYLDMQATTPTDPRVLDAMLPFMTNQYGNPHSKTHAYGWETESAVEVGRKVRHPLTIERS